MSSLGRKIEKGLAIASSAAVASGSIALLPGVVAERQHYKKACNEQIKRLGTKACNEALLPPSVVSGNSTGNTVGIIGAIGAPAGAFFLYMALKSEETKRRAEEESFAGETTPSAAEPRSIPDEHVISVPFEQRPSTLSLEQA
jgi:TctA family transporter